MTIGVYKYLWCGRDPIIPNVILDLPALPRLSHNFARVLIGPDGLSLVKHQATRATRVMPIHEDP